MKAKLVSQIEDWPYHSFNEYMSSLKGFCNIDLAREILMIPTQPDRFYKESYDFINDQTILEFLKD